MKNSILIKRLVGVAALTALVIALQFLSNYVTFGPVSITLALIPVAIGAILYGPLIGAFLGVVLGAVVLIAPTTGGFLGINPWATVIVCLGKTGIAGLLSGLIFKVFAFIGNRRTSKGAKVTWLSVGVVVAALVVPPTNTFLFCVGSILWFQDVMGTSFVAILSAIFATNFLIEFIVSAVLSPALIVLVKVLTRNYNLGFANEFAPFHEDEEENIEAIAL